MLPATRLAAYFELAERDTVQGAALRRLWKRKGYKGCVIAAEFVLWWSRSKPHTVETELCVVRGQFMYVIYKKQT